MNVLAWQHTRIERNRPPAHPFYGRIRPPHERTFNLVPQSKVPYNLLVQMVQRLFERYQQDHAQHTRSLFAPEVGRPGSVTPFS